MKSIIIIPSRLASTRLEKKPLQLINGKPMILHVVDCALKSSIKDIVVACGDQEIFDTVTNYGYKAILTDPNLPSGSDRIFDALNKIEQEYDVIVNLQGDIPLFDPKIIDETVAALCFGTKNESDIATPCKLIENKNEIQNPNIVKAYFKEEYPLENNIYRSTTFQREPLNDYNKHYHHIGIYAYKSSSLERFISLPISVNENKLKLEQMRAIDNNMTINCVITKCDLPLSVDTANDLDFAIQNIK